MRDRFHNSDFMKAIHSVPRDRAGVPAEDGPGGSGGPARAVLDISAAMDRVGGDKSLLKELAEIFLEDYPKQLTQIAEAIAKQDWTTAEREAHGLKGAVANFSAPDAVEAARALEFAVREGRHGELLPMLDRLRDQLSRVRAELDRLIAR